MSTPTMSGVTTLPAAEAVRVVDAHPELAELNDVAPLVVAVAARDRREAAVLMDMLALLRNRLRDEVETHDAVMRALLSKQDFPMPSALLEQVNRNAKARADLAAAYGLLTSSEVAQLANSNSSNAAALANRWKAEGKVFTVAHNGQQRFPGFQFDEDGRPRPVIAAVLDTFAGRLSDWETALWFTGDNSWLGGLRPADVLESDPGPVAEAADHLAAELLV